MYRIREFSAMTGLSQSKIRFYEKRGFLLSHREENGYRVFTPEDAFRSNAFRMLLQHGFMHRRGYRACGRRSRNSNEQSFLEQVSTGNVRPIPATAESDGKRTTIIVLRTLRLS